MSDPAVDPDVAKRLEELRKEKGDTVKTDDIAEVVQSILSTVHGDLTATDFRLYEELQNLAEFIDSAKTDIAALRPDEVKDEYLPTAADELDAIVEATAEATNSIMDATELVEGVMSELKGKRADALMDATTKIYEACGFQDITGQRITKVVGALKHIEERVDALVNAFGDEIGKYREKQAVETAEEPAAEAPPSDADLLQGPQLEGDGISQDEIDALLASFD